MTDIQVGDRVRVAFDGEVTAIGYAGVTIRRPDGMCGSHRHEDIDIEVIEKRKPQVGDTIEGSAAYAALPIAAVCKGKGGRTFVRVEGGFIWPGHPETLLTAERLYDPRELVYLP